MKITTEQIEQGRKLYSEFQRGMTGGFYTALFHAIAKAKAENVYRMAQGFAGEVYAYREYIGQLDPYMWDIEGETAADKFNRLTEEKKVVAEKDLSEILKENKFHYDGKALDDQSLAFITLFLNKMVNGSKNH